MTEKLDITGKVCPFCVLSVDQKMKNMPSGSTVTVLCDHGPAATGSIPEYANQKGWKSEVKLIENGLWEITITKN
ncbi:MAG: sulfurtransferase TusA family protein [Methanocalculaceae archaeon]|jgi:tRNA 2-thiouridine synthesizing protein A|nr:sulfurtransferase TusA family protein [Methanocalculaceae archaeon]